MSFCSFYLPCAEDAAVGLELLHEAVVGLDNGSTILDVRQSHIQRPVLLLHGVRNHRGPRAGDAHFTVDKHRLTRLPVIQRSKEAPSEGLDMLQECTLVPGNLT